MHLENEIIRREVLGEMVYTRYEETPIEVFEDMIKKFKEIGATHIDMCADIDYYDNTCNGMEYTPIKNFYETDEEKSDRLTKERIKQEQITKDNLAWLEKTEIDTLRKLKQKYE